MFLISLALTANNSYDVKGENIKYRPELAVLGVNAIEFTLLSEIVITVEGLTNSNLEACNYKRDLDFHILVHNFKLIRNFRLFMAAKIYSKYCYPKVGFH